MEVRINREKLLEGVQRVQGIVEVKGAMPILSYLLMVAENDGISVQATDLEIGAKGFYEANVVSEGRVALNARKLHDILRELPSEEIHLSKEENHWVTLKCGKAIFRLPGMSAEDFPPFPEFSEESLLQFKGRELKEMIRKTMFSVSPDETRKGISGLLLEKENGRVTMVGTDGHRLASISRMAAGAEGDKEDFILPKKALSELLKFMEDDDAVFNFSARENHLAFMQGRQVLVSRAIDGKFPNYRQVIPSDNELKITVSKDGLLHALKRVALLADEQSKMVRFEVDKGILTLISDNTELGAAREELVINHQGEEVQIGLNARYVLDILGAVEQNEVVMNLKDKDHSCLFSLKEDPDYLSLVMPMRL
tara:strand:- start:2544 stop:3644 length:1101 start_codon:yes stop_codon:yes gene_type:complete